MLVTIDPTTLSENERAIRSYLVSSIAFFDRMWSANNDDEFVLQYLAFLRDAGYFNDDYLLRCIKLHGEVKNDLELPHQVMTALLFHRLRYSPRDRKHVAKSIEFMIGRYPGEQSAILGSLVKAAQNKGYVFREKDHDHRYIADIAFHDFGAAWETFRNAWVLRLREFKEHMGQSGVLAFKEFSRRRLRLLTARAKEGGIFRTKHFRDKFESRALANIENMSLNLNAVVEQGMIVIPQ
jgi:hypothetical protein